MGVSLVYLTGFMGSGKTGVGRHLAELLGWNFVDLDSEIEKKLGRTIRELFARMGEPFFRAVEHEELRRVSRLRKAVVAMGGGAFCSTQNREIVDATGVSIWLDAPIEVLFPRCERDESRPLFTTREEMEQLLELRRRDYRKADLRIDASELDIDSLAQAILVHLQASGLLPKLRNRKPTGAHRRNAQRDAGRPSGSTGVRPAGRPTRSKSEL